MLTTNKKKSVLQVLTAASVLIAGILISACITVLAGAIFPDDNTAFSADSFHPAEKKELISALSHVKGGRVVRTFNSNYKIKRTRAGKKLIRYTKKLRRRYRKVRFVAIDIKTGEGFSFDAGKKTYSASCLKGPYVAALCKYKPRSYKKSKWNMRRTIVISNNDTYLALRLRYGSNVMKKLMRSSGVRSFKASRRYTYVPPRDLAKLWVSVYWYFYKDKNKVSEKCRALYTHGYQSFIYRAMKGKCKVHAKPGWFPGGGFNVQNDAGIIMAKVKGKSRPYVVCVMTSACGRHKQLRKLVRLINNVHTDMCRKFADQKKKAT